MELLNRAETRGARGTILYALSEIKMPAPLRLLVKMLIEESYEGQEEALSLLDREQFTATANERDDALHMLSGLKAQAADARLRELADAAIDSLSQ